MSYLVIILGRRIFRSLIMLPHFFQLFRSVKSIIGKPIFHQLLRILPVHWFSFTLAIWTIISSMHWTFVGDDTAPLKTIENIFLCSGNIATLIGVFNS